MSVSEQDILASCVVDRHAYDMLRMHMGFDELSPLGQHWLKYIEEYYERDPDARNCDRQILRNLGLGGASPQHEDTLAGFYDGLPIIGASPANVLAAILEYRRSQLGLQLAATVSSPDHDRERAAELVSAYQELLVLSENGGKSLRYIDYDNLEDFYDIEKIVPLFPQKVFKHKLLGGGAMPGHHILIYGRPEQGKTLFAIFQAAGMAYKGYKVLYCCNEEDPHIHAARAACSLTKTPISHYREHKHDIIAKARANNLDNIKFLKMEPGTFSEIETAIRDCSPQVVILDQLAGVEVGETNPVRAIDKAARKFRTLVGAYGCVGISVSQAGDRTERHGQEPPAWLSMSDVYGSRTGLPAQVDLMLGIGSDQDMRAQDIRAISLPKNKLGGDHDGFRLRFDKQLQRCTTLS